MIMSTVNRLRWSNQEVLFVIFFFANQIYNTHGPLFSFAPPCSVVFLAHGGTVIKITAAKQLLRLTDLLFFIF